MTAQTRYFVQAFHAGRRGAIIVERPVACGSAGTAIRAAEQLSGLKVAVMAFAMDGPGDPGADDAPMPLLLAEYGSLPRGSRLMAA